MAIRRSGAFLFTPWFFLLGACVVVGRGLKMDFSERRWSVRAGINLTYIVVYLVLTLLVRQLFAIPQMMEKIIGNYTLLEEQL